MAKKPSPFDQLKVTRENMRNSVQWYQSQVKILHRKSYQEKALMGSVSHLVANPVPGKLYLMKYDPKTKDTLPYYDTLPLILFIERKTKKSSTGESSFYGCNLHYLPPPMRIRLLQALFDISNNDRYDATTRIKLSYDILMRISSAKNLGADFAFKQYLYSHMESRFLEIPFSAYPIASILPIEQFQKANKTRVWHDAKQRV